MITLDPGAVVLGTVQLGLSYGRREGSPLLDEPTVTAILDRAWSLGIRAFDTAPAYGAAVTRLATWLDQRGVVDQAHVISKVVPADLGRPGVIHDALAPFEGAASLTLLTHGHVTADLWEPFARAVGLDGAAPGQSVYRPEEVRAAGELGATRVQAPANILAMATVHTARSSGVALDARSLYLQGILVSGATDAERRVAGGGEVAACIERAAREAGLGTATAVIAAVAQELADADRIVIGIDSPDQWLPVEELVSGVATDLVETFLAAIEPARAAAARRPALTDPRLW